MIVIYVRIYLVSSRIARAEALSKPNIEPGADKRASLTPTLNSETMQQQRKDSRVHAAETMLDVEDCGSTCNGRTQGLNGRRTSTRRSRGLSVADFVPEMRRRSTWFVEQRLRLFNSKARASASGERKATKTLGVIMGAFTACWLPFFILALIRPFCYDQESCSPPWLFSVFLWLGYTNSLLNPIIYARFNRDFRTPFKHILQCHVRDINSRLRSDNYTEQFGALTATVAGAQQPTADWLAQPRDSLTSPTADVIIRCPPPNRRTSRITEDSM